MPARKMKARKSMRKSHARKSMRKSHSRKSHARHLGITGGDKSAHPSKYFGRGRLTGEDRTQHPSRRR